MVKTQVNSLKATIVGIKIAIFAMAITIASAAVPLFIPLIENPVARYWMQNGMGIIYLILATILLIVGYKIKG